MQRNMNTSNRKQPNPTKQHDKDTLHLQRTSFSPVPAPIPSSSPSVSFSKKTASLYAPLSSYSYHRTPNRGTCSTSSSLSTTPTSIQQPSTFVSSRETQTLYSFLEELSQEYSFAFSSSTFSSSYLHDISGHKPLHKRQFEYKLGQRALNLLGGGIHTSLVTSTMDLIQDRTNPNPKRKKDKKGKNKNPNTGTKTSPSLYFHGNHSDRTMTRTSRHPIENRQAPRFPGSMSHRKRKRMLQELQLQKQQQLQLQLQQKCTKRSNRNDDDDALQLKDGQRIDPQQDSIPWNRHSFDSNVFFHWNDMWNAYIVHMIQMHEKHRKKNGTTINLPTSLSKLLSHTTVEWVGAYVQVESCLAHLSHVGKEGILLQDTYNTWHIAIHVTNTATCTTTKESTSKSNPTSWSPWKVLIVPKQGSTLVFKIRLPNTKNPPIKDVHQLPDSSVLKIHIRGDDSYK